MKKNLIIISFIICIILLTISITSAIEVNKNQSIENKESPLYKIRTRQVLGDRLKELIECIKAKFLGERMFFLPFQWLKNIINADNFNIDKPTNDITMCKSCATGPCYPSCSC